MRLDGSEFQGGVTSIGTRQAPRDAKLIILSRAEFDELERTAAGAAKSAVVEQTDDNGGGGSSWRRHRLRRGFSLEKLAQDLRAFGIDARAVTLWRIEVGLEPASPEIAEGTARALGVPVGELFG
jgi:hypothetical protein